MMLINRRYFTPYPLFAWMAVFVLVIPAFKTDTKPQIYIELQNERLPVSPKEFYVAGVADNRADRILANIVSPVVHPDKIVRMYAADLKGGAAALRSYIANSLPVNTNLRPVIITIKALKITEAALSGGRVSGQIALSVSFYLKQGEHLAHLVDYDGSAGYQCKAGPPQQIEPILRNTINNSLVYLNNWMNVQAGNNIKLAKGVKVSFEDYNEREEEGDTIYYNVNRPLKWTDFMGKPPYGSKYGAEIFASLGYNESVKLIKGIINITIHMKVYAPKSACWVKDYGAGDYHLNHEQRHFDIVKVVAGHFKKQILSFKLTTDNYDGPINVAYFDALREINKLQKQYDAETQHSTNNYQQQQWNNKIDDELYMLGVKPKSLSSAF